MVDAVIVGTLAASLALLAIGRLIGARGYLIMSLGWAFMAGFWGIQTIVVELIETGNASNAFFTGMAAVFALYLSYYSFEFWMRKEDSRPLKFMAGMAVISSIIYYPFEWSAELAGHLIYFVAVQTAWGLNAAGYSAWAGDIVHVGGQAYVPIHPTNVSIILACTAIQAFAIFGGAIAATSAPWKLKVKALVYSVVPIHLLNIVRNVGIIILVRDHGVDFEFAHSGLGKLFSLLALVVILYYIFIILPGLYDDIMGVLTLGDEEPPPSEEDGEGPAGDHEDDPDLAETDDQDDEAETGGGRDLEDGP